MADYTQSHSQPAERRDLAVERHNATLGLRLFFLYLAVYAAYVLINAFWPKLMDETVLAGLNLAIVFGLGLILLALLLALVYAFLCRVPRSESA